MIKNQSKSLMIYAILITTVIEYTVFSVQSVYLYSLLATVVLSAVFCVLKSNKQYIVTFMYSLVSSLIFYNLSFELSHSENLYYYIFSYLQIHISAVVLAKCFNKNINFKESIVYLTLSNTVIAIAELAKYKYIDNINLSELYNETFTENINMYFQTLQSAGTEFDYTKMYEIINAGKNTVIILIPAILIIVMFISAFIIYEISKYVMVSFTRKTFSDDSKYRNFKINGALSLITIALLLTSALSDSEMYSNAVLNFSIISSFVYLANGFAVICHYLIKKINNKVLVIISAIAVIIMTFMSVFMISSINGFTIIFFIGLLDTTFDFRKIRPNVIKRRK